MKQNSNEIETVAAAGAAASAAASHETTVKTIIRRANLLGPLAFLSRLPPPTTDQNLRP